MPLLSQQAADSVHARLGEPKRGPTGDRRSDGRQRDREGTAVYRGTVSDLRALRPPKADQEAYTSMVESFDRGVTAVEASSERVPPDTAVSWEAAFGVAAPHMERAGRAAAGLELEACAG